MRIGLKLLIIKIIYFLSACTVLPTGGADIRDMPNPTISIVNSNSQCQENLILYVGVQNKLVLNFQGNNKDKVFEIKLPEGYKSYAIDNAVKGRCLEVWPIGPFSNLVDTLIILEKKNEILKVPFERRFALKMNAKFYDIPPNDTLKSKIFNIRTENFQLIDPQSCYLYNAKVVGFKLLFIRNEGEEIIDEFDYTDISGEGFETDTKMIEILELLKHGDKLVFESIIVLSNDGQARKIGKHIYYVGW